MFETEKYKIERYPATDNKSLKAWNSGDEHVLKYFDDKSLSDKQILLANDSFGYLATQFNQEKIFYVLDSKSQEKVLKSNFELNSLPLDNINFVKAIDALPNSVDTAVLKIPKSNDLFRLYLYQIHKALSADGEVVCSFMTKNFNKSVLTIASELFGSVEQSLAWKKSRLLILKNPKNVKYRSLFKEIQLNDENIFKQYLGVFSANHIDYATQFLIPEIKLNDTDSKLLDLASGNGILAYELRKASSDSEIHLVDDSFLAIESSKINLGVNEKTIFECNDNLENYNDDFFDYVISNPPFHFGYENNIEISISLFKEVKRTLKKGGRFQVVANNHLNYRTHLERMFSKVWINGKNENYVVYECFK